jgi:hypothetical protein
MTDVAASAGRIRAGRRVAITAVAVLVVSLSFVGFVSVVESRGYDSPAAAVRATCHPAEVIRTLKAGVMWQTASDPAGVGWLASAEHHFGGRYTVKDCRSQQYTHA